MTNATPTYIVNKAEEPTALFIFAHGAGAGMSHAFMESVTQGLVKHDISVIRFNFPYMDKRALDGKRRPPDRMPTLEICYQTYIDECLSYIDETHLHLPIFIGGKSMGGRVAATCAAKKTDGEKTLNSNVKGVVCIGYPFHPAKKVENLRLAPLMESVLPIYIAQGDRDALGNKEEVISYQLPDNCHVEYLPDGDHDLKPRVKSGFTHQQHIDTTIKLIAGFMREKSK